MRDQKAIVAALTREADTLRGQLIAMGAPAATPGTRIRWSNLREWLDGWRDLVERRISSRRHEQHRAHLLNLSDAVVEAASPAELDELKQVLAGVTPARGQRTGHPATRLRDAIDRTRHRSGARRLLDVAARVPRTNPPAGIEPTYIDAFFA